MSEEAAGAAASSRIGNASSPLTPASTSPEGGPLRGAKQRAWSATRQRRRHLKKEQVPPAAQGESAESPSVSQRCAPPPSASWYSASAAESAAACACGVCDGSYSGTCVGGRCSLAGCGVEGDMEVDGEEQQAQEQEQPLLCETCEGRDFCGEDDEESSPCNPGEETPVVVWGRCLSSDGWREEHGSLSSSDESSSSSNPTPTPSPPFPQDHAACSSVCAHARWSFGEDKADAVEAEPWISEAVRYMEIVVEGSSSGVDCVELTTSPSSSSAASAACTNSRTRYKAPSEASRSLDLMPQHVAAAAAATLAEAGGGSRRARRKTATGDFAQGRAADASEAGEAVVADVSHGVSLQEVHVLVLKLYQELQKVAAQVMAKGCECARGSCLQQQKQQQPQQQKQQQKQQQQQGTPPMSNAEDEACNSADSGKSSASSSKGSGGSGSRLCACCAFGTPLRIGAALTHLYNENPDRFSLLIHDSVLLALLPLQRHAAAALADAVVQQPSPLAGLLGGGAPSELLKQTAEATAARVVAAGAASSRMPTRSDCSKPQQERQQETAAAAESKGPAVYAIAAQRYWSSSSSSGLKWGDQIKRRSWPGCMWKPKSRESKGSYSCCGVPLCPHKLAAAKRYMEQQQFPQREVLYRQLPQKSIVPTAHYAVQEAQQEYRLEQQPKASTYREALASAKDAEASPSARKREDSEEESLAASTPKERTAAKTAATPSAKAAGDGKTPAALTGTYELVENDATSNGRFSASADEECGTNSTNSERSDPNVDFPQGAANRGEESGLPLRCTHTAVPRPALKTNPVLRRLMQLQGGAGMREGQAKQQGGQREEQKGAGRGIRAATGGGIQTSLGGCLGESPPVCLCGLMTVTFLVGASEKPSWSCQRLLFESWRED
ncbi:uncharacterized protein LOC34622321 [Cyclospora cayetanensis]|uniref:Uncharacterized protein LOC34622321 n=1 Tax=Cyclospora cayetanensis TaxID=88456 RepID=A0A6P6RUC6_9EIME|nr:uncharacterized protein LOC34622321 [Cyclospora cayetanensis]